MLVCSLFQRDILKENFQQLRQWRSARIGLWSFQFRILNKMVAFKCPFLALFVPMQEIVNFNEKKSMRTGKFYYESWIEGKLSSVEGFFIELSTILILKTQSMQKKNKKFEILECNLILKFYSRSLSFRKQFCLSRLKSRILCGFMMATIKLSHKFSKICIFLKMTPCYCCIKISI